MDFSFTQDQQDLIDAAKAVFDGENTVERMRAMVAGEEVEDLWPKFAELGLIGVMAPEENGGLGQPLVVMAGIAEVAGYAGLPEPLVEIAGVTVPELIDATISPDDVVNGKVKTLVTNLYRPYIHEAMKSDALMFGDQWYAKDTWPPDRFALHQVKSIDPLRNLGVGIFTYRSPGGTPGTGGGHINGAVLTAAQLVGLSQRMVDMSVDYAKDRYQFGKPIGSFQAIKHQLANVYTQIEFTRPMVHLAALQGGRAVHTAKVAAIDTAMLAAETAIQVHGGMGYTFEVDLHLFMKRAWALCGEWGDRNYHMKKLEDLVLVGREKLGAGTTF